MENNNLRKMDQFVSIMEQAFALANDIEGIDSICWSIQYRGTTEATNEIASRINKAMKEADMGNIGYSLNI